ncbi:MAG: hypothetical protein QNJ75_13345 [Acidimicrobiia bacterium]|nr:hypothetical protein [Acidimicrobiia bacterium]
MAADITANLSNWAVLVTGGSRGIGVATAVASATAGGEVFEARG